MIGNRMAFGNMSLLKIAMYLPSLAREKIKELVKDATNDREKVKILYDYLGQSTRYVSIQLGIGGYQPLFASEVFKTGFGDCKALSNYLKAMLSVVGIPSYYAGIKADGTEKRLYPDFPNFNQMNHVILQVPLAADTAARMYQPTCRLDSYTIILPDMMYWL